MIYGIGTDIVAVGRIEAALNRFGDRFARRILAAVEWDDDVSRSSELAGWAIATEREKTCSIS